MSWLDGAPAWGYHLQSVTLTGFFADYKIFEDSLMSQRQKVACVVIYSNEGGLLLSAQSYCLRSVSFMGFCGLHNIIPFLMSLLSWVAQRKSCSFHCVKNIRIWSYSGPHFSRISPHSDWIQTDTEYLFVFSLNAGKCGKNADQNNFAYGHLLRSLLLIHILI